MFEFGVWFVRVSIRNMIFTALFAAVICAVAPFSIFIGPVPITFSTLVIYFAAGVLGWKYGVLSITLYILLGAIGLPVFTGFEGGFHKIIGVTGGYIIGYIPCVFATGMITGVFRKKLWAYVFGMVIGTILLYTCGTAWFIFQTGNSLAASLTLCVIPFLPGDTIKIILARVVTPQLQRALVKVES